jgi:hypothetical protein
VARVLQNLLVVSLSLSSKVIAISEVVDNRHYLHIGGFGSSPLALSLRDIMLQENIDSQDSDNTICDLIRDACTEIMCSKVALSRCHAYDFMYRLYFLPAGRKELSRLGRDGGLLQVLSEKVFHK